MDRVTVAVSGAHGSGKTTLLHGAVADLKRRGIDAVLVPEAARQSPFLIAKQRSLSSQLHIFLAHCESELRHELVAGQVVLTDRTPIDMIAYTELFFPGECEAITAMKAFSHWYMQRYASVFVTTKLYDPTAVRDRFRPDDRELQVNAAKRIVALLNEQYPAYVGLPEDANLAQNMVVGRVCQLIGVV